MKCPYCEKNVRMNDWVQHSEIDCIVKHPPSAEIVSKKEKVTGSKKKKGKKGKKAE